MEITEKLRFGKEEKALLSLLPVSQGKEDRLFSVKEKKKTVGCILLQSAEGAALWNFRVWLLPKEGIKEREFVDASIQALRIRIPEKTLALMIPSQHETMMSAAADAGCIKAGRFYTEIFSRERFLYDKHGYLVGKILSLCCLSKSQLRKLKEFCNRELSARYLLAVNQYQKSALIRAEHMWPQVFDPLSFVLLRKERIAGAMLFSRPSKEGVTKLLFSGHGGDQEDALDFEAEVMGRVCKECPFVAVDSLEDDIGSMMTRTLFLQPTKQSFAVYFL